MERGTRALARVLQRLLASVAGVILAGSVFIMLNLGPGPRGQGGRFYVAVAAVVLLGVVVGQLGRLVERRAPLGFGTPAAVRRYYLWSLLLLAFSATGLVGFVLLWP